MVATFNWEERNGEEPGVVSIPTNLNFGSADQVDLTPSENPIIAGKNSYEKWLRGRWQGIFTSISNLKLWWTGSFVSGTVVKFGGNGIVEYEQPVDTTSTYAVDDVPSSAPGTANISINGGLGNSLLFPGWSDYFVMQLQVDSGVSAGPLNQVTYHLSYDEV